MLVEFVHYHCFLKKICAICRNKNQNIFVSSKLDLNHLLTIIIVLLSSKKMFFTKLYSACGNSISLVAFGEAPHAFNPFTMPFAFVLVTRNPFNALLRVSEFNLPLAEISDFDFPVESIAACSN